MSGVPVLSAAVAAVAQAAAAAAAAAPAAAPAAGDQDLYQSFAKCGIALAIGLLVGLEREWAKAGDPSLFAGIRTFPFISLFGCLSAMIASERTPWFFPAAFLGFAGLVAASHYVSASKMQTHGTTTEVTSLLVFLLGGLAFWGHLRLAAATAVVATVILSMKEPLHRLAHKVEAADIYATLKFAVISVIVLPILPDEGYGYQRVLNPRQIWLLVVFISGISFLGYIAMKTLGVGRGIVLTGLLGGLVSSTAVAMSMAERSKEEDRLSPQLALAVVLAATMMFPRTIVEVLLVNRWLAFDLLLPLLGAAAFGIVASTYLWYRGGARAAPEHVKLQNPFRLAPALTFGLLFALMLIASKAAAVNFQSAGVYVTAAVGGFIDVRPIALSVARLAVSGDVRPSEAVAAVMLAALANTVTKAALSSWFGTPLFRRKVLPAFVLLVLGGIAATAFAIRGGAR